MPAAHFNNGSAGEPHAHEGVARDPLAIHASDRHCNALAVIDRIDELAYMQVGNASRSVRCGDG
jgi:hypothetical protein